MNEEPCSREHLVALVPVYNRWEVDENGRPEDCYDHDDINGEFDDVDEYYCDNCHDFFTPATSEGRRYSTSEEIAIAWQAALDHLKVKVER